MPEWKSRCYAFSCWCIAHGNVNFIKIYLSLAEYLHGYNGICLHKCIIEDVALLCSFIVWYYYVVLHDIAM